MVKLTLKLRLNGSVSAFAALRETAKTYTESFNRVSQVAYSMPRQNKTELHKLTYKQERSDCDLPSQLVYYTSQECSRCGHTSQENRKNQSEFECKKCKLRLNADVNAARVIKKRYLAKSGKTAVCGRPVNPPIVSSKHQSEPVSTTNTSLRTETSPSV
jgi:tRNA(Ile2) C34 agmatinyltransferase TiaS